MPTGERPRLPPRLADRRPCGGDGLDVGILQDGPPELARHHFDHQLVGLFREGGNVPALAARAEGAPTRLIGLTWIDEWQKILVRPDSGITSADRPPRAPAGAADVGADAGGSFPRAMSLHGYQPRAVARRV